MYATRICSFLRRIMCNVRVVLIDLGVVISRPKRVPGRSCLTGYEQGRM